MTLFVFFFVPHLFFRIGDNIGLITVIDEICCAIDIKSLSFPNHVGSDVFLMEKFTSFARTVGYFLWWNVPVAKISWL